MARTAQSTVLSAQGGCGNVLRPERWWMHRMPLCWCWERKIHRLDWTPRPRHTSCSLPRKGQEPEDVTGWYGTMHRQPTLIILNDSRIAVSEWLLNKELWTKCWGINPQDKWMVWLGPTTQDCLLLRAHSDRSYLGSLKEGGKRGLWWWATSFSGAHRETSWRCLISYPISGWAAKNKVIWHH